MSEMTNGDLFENIFGIYATELWSMTENDFLNWLNAEAPKTECIAEKRKKGKWIHFSRSDECSVCGYDTGKYEAPTWFCPKCGADMR